METIVKAIPDGYRTITPNITVRDAANALAKDLSPVEMKAAQEAFAAKMNEKH